MEPINSQVNNNLVQPGINVPARTPEQFATDKKVSRQLMDFCETHCGGMPATKMFQFIEAGKKIEERLADPNNKATDLKAILEGITIPTSDGTKRVKGENNTHMVDKQIDSSEAIVALMWVLTAKVAEHSDLFVSGAMRLAEGEKTRNFLVACGSSANGPGVYNRISTHMGEHLTLGAENPQKGIDLGNQGLPAGKRTVLFALQPDGSLYLKMEEHGCPPPMSSFKNFLEFMGHVFDFIKTRFTGEDPKARKEAVPKAIKNNYKVKLENLLDPKTQASRIDTLYKEGVKFGKSRMEKILHELVDETDRGNAGTKAAMTRDLGLDKARTAGYRAEIKGNEAWIPPLGTK